MAAMGRARKPVNTLWRAGLSRVGLRSSPIKEDAVYQTLCSGWFWGLLRSPTRDKPAHPGRFVRV